jgi:transcriptional regulator with XRE-family HTH domain
MARRKPEQDAGRRATELWGEELRTWRRAAGLTQAQLAAAIHCDQSWISDLERGTKAAGPQVAVQLDEVLHTGGVLLRTLEYQRREVTDYHPDWFRFYRGMEAKAVRMCEWTPYMLSGMLQTEAVMRDQFEQWGHSPSRVSELTEARLERQERLFGADPLQLLVIMDESVLRRIVSNPLLGPGQLAHLLQLSQRRNVAIQVFPFGRAHPAATSSLMAFLELPRGARWFYSEALDRGYCTDERDEVRKHSGRYDRMRFLSLSVTESRTLFRRTLGEMVNMSKPEPVGHYADMSPLKSIAYADLKVFKSSHSTDGNGGCVGASRTHLGSGLVPVVDTTLGASSPILPFTTAAFASFVDAIKSHDPAFAFGEQYVTLC